MHGVAVHGAAINGGHVSTSQWGDRRHTLTLEHLNNRSKLRASHMLPVRPHTMAGTVTESGELSKRRVVPVLGAQFRSRPTSSSDDRHSMPGSAGCPGCAALNSKLHRSHKQLAELAELRSREREARGLAEGYKERLREMEEGWRSHRQKTGLEFERVRREALEGVQSAREAAEAADARAARLQAPSFSATAWHCQPLPRRPHT